MKLTKTTSCCNKLEMLVAEDYLFNILEHLPFQPEKKTPPTVYVMSDGGHGGSEPIKFCPFCGRSIEITIALQEPSSES